MSVARFDKVERDKIVVLSQQTLWSSDGEIGRKYLMDERKINENTIRKFSLGFVPSNTNHQLASRIIFPIFDASDHLIAISSRLVNGYESNLPIYWHEKYEKSFYLYGLNFAKYRARQVGFLIVVEGNFDVLSCHNAGLTNVVGLFGTSVSDFHLALFLRYCENVIFVFDNDENKAGDKASERVRFRSKLTECKVNLQKYQYSSTLNLLNCGFVNLDKHKDPDDYIKNEGIYAFKRLVNNEWKKLKNV